MVFLVKFEINLHLWVFLKAEIALSTASAEKIIVNKIVMKIANFASVPVFKWCNDKEDYFAVVKIRKHIKVLNVLLRHSI